MKQKESKKKDKKHSKSRAEKEEQTIGYEDEPDLSNKRGFNVDEKMTRAQVKPDGVDNAQTFEHPASFQAQTGKLNAQSLKNFAQNVDIDIRKVGKEEIVFDLCGVEPPLANALRRIMIAEIPSMAIEKVTMWQNTSVLPDENLAHRMGLIPIKADARLFEMHKP